MPAWKVVPWRDTWSFYVLCWQCTIEDGEMTSRFEGLLKFFLFEFGVHSNAMDKIK